MKAGKFNIDEYLEKLYEEAETANKSAEEGLIIPPENRKAYDWLKREYKKGQTEVKVEMSFHTFKPGYELDTNLKSVKDFKPGMYGQIKTSDTEGSKKQESKSDFKPNDFSSKGKEEKGKKEEEKSTKVEKIKTFPKSEKKKEEEKSTKVEKIKTFPKSEKKE